MVEMMVGEKVVEMVGMMVGEKVEMMAERRVGERVAWKVGLMAYHWVEQMDRT